LQGAGIAEEREAVRLVLDLDLLRRAGRGKLRHEGGFGVGVGVGVIRVIPGVKPAQAKERDEKGE